nr:high-affinity nitrate transporter 3.1-like [Tanacetum cinerariifolium]
MENHPAFVVLLVISCFATSSYAHNVHLSALNKSIIVTALRLHHQAKTLQPANPMTTNILDSPESAQMNHLLRAGVDSITIMWSYDVSLVATAPDTNYNTSKGKLCYAPVSQVGRDDRKTDDRLDNDKTCPVEIMRVPYQRANNSYTWLIPSNTTTATYFVRVYIDKPNKHEIAYGQRATATSTTTTSTATSTKTATRLVQRIVYRCLQQDDIHNGDHVQAVVTTDDSLAIPKHTTVETPMNMSPANKAHFEAEKEAIHLILTGIGYEIYSTVDACQTPQEMWEAIERQFGNQRTMNVAGAKENVGSPVVQQYGIQCFNCKEFGHFAKKCKKPKRVKDFAYHKEKMLLCKQAEKGVPLQAEQYDWLADTDEEIDEQELEAHYNYMEKIQEVPIADTVTDYEPLELVQNDDGYNVFPNDLQHFEQSESISNTCLVKTDDSNVIPNSPDICEDDIHNDQNDVESDDKLANLIANLKLDTEFEKYNAFNDRTINYDKLERKLNETLGQLAQKDIEIKEGLKTKAYEISVVKEKHGELIKQSLLTKSHYEGLAKLKTKVTTDLKLKEEHDIDKMLSMEKQLKFLNEIVYKRSQSIQTIHMMAPKVSTYNGRPTFANPRYLKQAQSEIPCLYALPYVQSTHANRIITDGEETLALERERTCLMPLALKTQNDNFIFVHELKQEMHADLKYVESLEKEIDELKSDKAEFSNMYDMILQEYLKAQIQDEDIAISELKKLIEKGKGNSVETKFDKLFVVRQPDAQRIPKPSVLGVNHKTNVSRPQHRRNQLKDNAVPNNSQVKLKKTQVEEHPRISRISNKIKSVTACNDSLNSRTLNVNAVCATCKQCLVDSDYFDCVNKMLNDMNARTKKLKVVPISTRKAKGYANKSIATPHKKKVASKSTNQKP